jgi:hypothetical protein
MTNNEAKMAEEICNLRAALRDASNRLEQVLESGLPGKGRSQDEKDSVEGWWVDMHASVQRAERLLSETSEWAGVIVG